MATASRATSRAAVTASAAATVKLSVASLATDTLRPGAKASGLARLGSKQSRPRLSVTPSTPSLSSRPSASSAVGSVGLSAASAVSSVYVAPTETLPVPDGDVYIINTMSARAALSLAYTRDNKVLALGESNGGIRIFKTGKPDEICCLSPHLPPPHSPQLQHLPLPQLPHLPHLGGHAEVGGGAASPPGPGSPTAGSIRSARKAGAVTCLRPWLAEPSRPTLLASYADGKIRLWDVRFGSTIREICEDRQCLGLAVSPDVRRFVSLGDDGAVLLYDAETGSLLAKMEHSGFSDVVDGHRSRVLSGVFHPLDLNGVVTGGWDNVLQFWDTRVAQAVRHAGEIHIGGTESIDISPDGREVLSCSWRNKDQIQIWDYGTARLIETLDPDNSKSYLYTGRYLSENLLCCGGASPNLFRSVHIGQKVTVGTITGLSYGISSIALGPTGAKYFPNPSLNNGKNVLPHCKDKCPRVAVCTNNRVIEIEFY